MPAKTTASDLSGRSRQVVPPAYGVLHQAGKQHMVNALAMMQHWIAAGDYQTAGVLASLLAQMLDHRHNPEELRKAHERTPADHRHTAMLAGVTECLKNQRHLSGPQLVTHLRKLTQRYPTLEGMEAATVDLSMVLVQQGEFEEAHRILSTLPHSLRARRRLLKFTRMGTCAMIRHMQWLQALHKVGEVQRWRDRWQQDDSDQTTSDQHHAARDQHGRDASMEDRSMGDDDRAGPSGGLQDRKFLAGDAGDGSGGEASQEEHGGMRGGGAGPGAGGSEGGGGGDDELMETQEHQQQQQLRHQLKEERIEHHQQQQQQQHPWRHNGRRVDAREGSDGGAGHGDRGDGDGGRDDPLSRLFSYDLRFWKIAEGDKDVKEMAREAEMDLRNALGFRPDATLLSVMLCQVYVVMGKMEEACKVAEKAAAAAPLDADARMLAALMQQLMILHGEDDDDDDQGAVIGGGGLVVGGAERSMAAGSALAFLTGNRAALGSLHDDLPGRRPLPANLKGPWHTGMLVGLQAPRPGGSMAIGSWGPPLGALDPELQDERLHASVWSQLEAMRIDPLNTGALQGLLNTSEHCWLCTLAALEGCFIYADMSTSCPSLPLGSRAWQAAADAVAAAADCLTETADAATALLKQQQQTQQQEAQDQVQDVHMNTNDADPSQASADAAAAAAAAGQPSPGQEQELSPDKDPVPQPAPPPLPGPLPVFSTWDVGFPAGWGLWQGVRALLVERCDWWQAACFRAECFNDLAAAALRILVNLPELTGQRRDQGLEEGIPNGGLENAEEEEEEQPDRMGRQHTRSHDAANQEHINVATQGLILLGCAGVIAAFMLGPLHERTHRVTALLTEVTAAATLASAQLQALITGQEHRQQQQDGGGGQGLGDDGMGAGGLSSPGGVSIYSQLSGGDGNESSQGDLEGSVISQSLMLMSEGSEEESENEGGLESERRGRRGRGRSRGRARGRRGTRGTSGGRRSAQKGAAGNTSGTPQGPNNQGQQLQIPKIRALLAGVQQIHLAAEGAMQEVASATASATKVLLIEHSWSQWQDRQADGPVAVAMQPQPPPQQQQQAGEVEGNREVHQPATAAGADTGAGPSSEQQPQQQQAPLQPQQLNKQQQAAADLLARVLAGESFQWTKRVPPTWLAVFPALRGQRGAGHHYGRADVGGQQGGDDGDDVAVVEDAGQ